MNMMGNTGAALNPFYSDRLLGILKLELVVPRRLMGGTAEVLELCTCASLVVVLFDVR